MNATLENLTPRQRREAEQKPKAETLVIKITELIHAYDQAERAFESKNKETAMKAGQLLIQYRRQEYPQEEDTKEFYLWVKKQFNREPQTVRIWMRLAQFWGMAKERCERNEVYVHPCWARSKTPHPKPWEEVWSQLTINEVIEKYIKASKPKEEKEEKEKSENKFTVQEQIRANARFFTLETKVFYDLNSQKTLESIYVYVEKP